MQDKASPAEEYFSRAVGFSLLASFTFFTCFLYLNEEQVTGFEGTFIRGLMLMICGYSFCLKDGKSTTFPGKASFATLCVRSIMMILYAAATGASQFYLPLPLVHTICGSGPIFVFIIDYYMNGVRINSKQLMGIIIAVAGLVLAINGGMFMKYLDPDFETHS